MDFQLAFLINNCPHFIISILVWSPYKHFSHNVIYMTIEFTSLFELTKEKIESSSIKVHTEWRAREGISLPLLQ